MFDADMLRRIASAASLSCRPASICPIAQARSAILRLISEKFEYFSLKLIRQMCTYENPYNTNQKIHFNTYPLQSFTCSTSNQHCSKKRVSVLKVGMYTMQITLCDRLTFCDIFLLAMFTILSIFKSGIFIAISLLTEETIVLNVDYR